MKTIKIIFSFIYAFIFQYVIFFILLLGGALGEILNVRKDTNLDFIIMFFFSILFVIFYIILVKKILGNWWFTLPIIILSILTASFKADFIAKPFLITLIHKCSEHENVKE